MQKQPELHRTQPPFSPREQGVPEANGNGPSSSATHDEDEEEDPDNPRRSTVEERWPAVKAAQVNEPVGIITIEDVLEELIGQVQILIWSNPSALPCPALPLQLVTSCAVLSCIVQNLQHVVQLCWVLASLQGSRVRWQSDRASQPLRNDSLDQLAL